MKNKKQRRKKVKRVSAEVVDRLNKSSDDPGKRRIFEIEASRSGKFSETHVARLYVIKEDRSVALAEVSGRPCKIRKAYEEVGLFVPELAIESAPETDDFGYESDNPCGQCHHWPCSCEDRFGDWTSFEETTSKFSKEDLLVIGSDKSFANNKYGVFVKTVTPDEHGFGDFSMTHLSIKTHDRAPENDWREFQRIKNELCSPECEAIQIYPAESRLVDTSNQYHLWVFPDESTIPLGFHARCVVEEINSVLGVGKSRQRAYPEDQKPEDIVSVDEMEEKKKKYEENIRRQNDENLL